MRGSFGDWACEMHAQTNHYYDTDLNNPYAFHLQMTVIVGAQFKHLLPEYHKVRVPSNNSTYYDRTLNTWREIVEPALWGHDLIEDARQTYGKILFRSNEHVAEIIRAVTSYTRGRNRDERMPPEVYEDIRTTPFATFVKLCDRIANVRYSNMMQSRQLEMYRKEYPHFKKELYRDIILQPMWDELERLLNITA